MLNRDAFIKKLDDVPLWDIIVIGGGATGLGIAVDAASRGLTTLLLEGADFAKGTSSRSTKLVHGGVRYLAQGRFRLVYEALHERGWLQRNAPHLVKCQSFIIPCYTRFEKWRYLIGLKLYDWLSGTLSFGTSVSLSRKKLMDRLPNINHKNLRGGVEYFDGQFDDTRLAINLAQTAAEHGAVLLNYCSVTGFQKKNGQITGVVCKDEENNREYRLASRSVVNATGVFVDDVLVMDQPGAKPLVRPSQGVHLVFDKHFLQSNSAVMIPETSDGRVLFAVPWHDHVLVGTTDTPLDQHNMEPQPLESEIRFLLDTVSQYFIVPPKQKDVLSQFAGLRPLAAPQSEGKRTKEISRDHKIWVSESGLISITGGKWTTYRRMAEQVVDKAIAHAGLPAATCITKTLRIHGHALAASGHLAIYGSDADAIAALVKEEPLLGKTLVTGFPHIIAEVVWAIRHEMARTIEDVLARRLRILFLDAAAAMEAAPIVARLLKKELQRDDAWEQEALRRMNALAQQYGGAK